jgi:hypothetical protein
MHLLLVFHLVRPCAERACRHYVAQARSHFRQQRLLVCGGVREIQPRVKCAVQRRHHHLAEEAGQQRTLRSQLRHRRCPSVERRPRLPLQQLNQHPLAHRLEVLGVVQLL